MKKYLIGLITVCMLTVVGVANAGWHEESQAMRNQQIVNQANHDLYLKSYPACKSSKKCTVGGQCFPWVQDVVRVAAMLAGVTPQVYIPGPDATGWHLMANPAILAPQGTISPSAFQKGMILQMRVHIGGRSTYTANDYVQHTVVVGNNSNQSVTLVESNYEIANQVTTRTVPYSWFTDYRNVESGNHYYAYYVR